MAIKPERISNTESYGLVHFDIYKPNAEETHVTSPEGFDITIHGDTSTVADGIKTERIKRSVFMMSYITIIINYININLSFDCLYR